MEEETKVIIRDFSQDQDQAFIYATWRLSSYYSNLKPHTMQAKDYFSFKTAEIKELIKKAQVRIACLSDSPITIIGYSVSHGEHLYFVYVKEQYRKQGIGNLLLPKDIKTVSDDLTVIGAVIADKKKLKLKKENQYGDRTGREATAH